MDDLTANQLPIIPLKDKIILPTNPTEQLSPSYGGWLAESDALGKGKVRLEATNQRILIGDATEPLTGTGVFIGSDKAATVGYDFRVGDPAGNYMHWDASATTLTVVGSITGSTITGGTFQTATSGQRIVIASSDNTLTFYNASAAVVAQIGGGMNIANAVRIVLDASTQTGVKVTSSTAADIGFSYSSSGNYAQTGVNVQLNGATNSGVGVNVKHEGSSGDGVFVNVTNAAIGLLITNSGTAASVSIIGSGTSAGASLQITHTGDSTKGIEVLYAGRANALYIESTDTSNDAAALYVTGDTASQGSGNFVAHFMRTDSGIVAGITTSINTASNSIGLEFNIANAGAGTEYAMSFAGSEYLSVAVAGTQNRTIKVLIGGGAYYIPAYDSHA